MGPLIPKPQAPIMAAPEKPKEEKKKTRVDPNRDEQIAAAARRRRQLLSRRGRRSLVTQTDQRVGVGVVGKQE